MCFNYNVRHCHKLRTCIMYGSLIPVLMLMMMMIESRVLGLVVRSYAIRSVCLSFCLSLCIITAKVIRQFHWNVVLWLGLYQLQELINFRGVPFLAHKETHGQPQSYWDWQHKKFAEEIRRCKGVGARYKLFNSSSVQSHARSPIVVLDAFPCRRLWVTR